MRVTRDLDLQPYLDRLKQTPFVRAVKITAQEPRARDGHADALLRLRTAKEEYDLWVEVKRTHLTRTIVDGFMARVGPRERKRCVVFAPYVGAETGRYLREKGINYVDLAGNCFLAIGKDHVALVEGKRPEKKGLTGRGIGVAGHQTVFAILARPDLLNAPVRVLAKEAGVGKTAVAEMLARLEDEGMVGVDRAGRRLLHPKRLLDRWLAGYTALVRPRLLIGRFRTNDPDPGALENRMEMILRDDVEWAWGGAAAAMRLTRHFRGQETVLHLVRPLANLGQRLKALPADDGPLIVLGVPGRVALNGAVERTVHPMLVYTELVASGQERALEAAEEIWGRFLARNAG